MTGAIPAPHSLWWIFRAPVRSRTEEELDILGYTYIRAVYLSPSTLAQFEHIFARRAGFDRHRTRTRSGRWMCCELPWVQSFLFSGDTSAAWLAGASFLRPIVRTRQSIDDAIRSDAWAEEQLSCSMACPISVGQCLFYSRDTREGQERFSSALWPGVLKDAYQPETP